MQQQANLQTKRGEKQGRYWDPHRGKTVSGTTEAPESDTALKAAKEQAAAIKAIEEQQALDVVAQLQGIPAAMMSC